MGSSDKNRKSKMWTEIKIDEDTPGEGMTFS